MIAARPHSALYYHILSLSAMLRLTKVRAWPKRRQKPGLSCSAARMSALGVACTEHNCPPFSGQPRSLWHLSPTAVPYTGSACALHGLHLCLYQLCQKPPRTWHRGTAMPHLNALLSAETVCNRLK